MPELKGWDCADVADLERWSPSDDEVIFWMTLSIGLPGSPAADNFEVCVATPGGLRSALGRETRPRGREAPHPIVLQAYSWPTLWEEIQSRLRASAGTDWFNVQEKLRRRFAWEYEGYK